MPLEVFSTNGEYIGIIKDKFMKNSNLFKVAITDCKIQHTSININEIKNYLASKLGCKSILGKLNDRNLEEKIKKITKEELHINMKQLSYNNLLKLLFLKYVHDKDIIKFVSDNMNLKQIKGYILFDLDKIQVIHDKVIINDEIDYISDEIIGDLYDDAPVFCKIIDYPIIKWYADDMSKQSRSKETIVAIKSGNAQEEIVLPTMINCKKDMNMQLFMMDKKIKKIFCDGVSYIKGW